MADLDPTARELAQGANFAGFEEYDPAIIKSERVILRIAPESQKVH
jgi:hypothetical protein